MKRPRLIIGVEDGELPVGRCGGGVATEQMTIGGRGRISAAEAEGRLAKLARW